MPELPEVETTRIGIAPYVLGQTITRVIVRHAGLRWPVPAALSRKLRGRRIRAVRRRAKYLLFELDHGGLILHLGMSGSLRVIPAEIPPGPYDHLDLVLANQHCLRLRDPRRFGSVHWTEGDPANHPLLGKLGPEPLGKALTGEYLHARSRGRKLAVKNFLMDSRIIAGIGNIYANEALYAAGIHPARPAGRITLPRYRSLARALRRVLNQAIARGGTTLRDFVRSDGEPGYFRLALQVYDRAGLHCRRCGAGIRRRVIGQRASYYCPTCQR